MRRARSGRRAFVLGGAAAAAVVLWACAWHWRELKAWYLLATRFEGLPRNAQGYLEYRHRRTGLIFVRLPGGKFLMGSPSGEEGRGLDEEQHEVSLSPFLIAKHELSQDVWQDLMGRNPSTRQGGELPVDAVSWDDCREFCSRTELAFPTEAQWEFACRAGSGSAFAFGETVTREQANLKGAKGSTIGVVSSDPNGFGLHNMHGNVREWCEDVYDEGFYFRPEARVRDPLCSRRREPGLAPERRVNRGGVWFSGPLYARSAARLKEQRNNSTQGSYIGFRPAFNLR